MGGNLKSVCALLCIILTGCVTQKMYEGPVRSDQEVGKFYTHQRPNMQIISLDGQELNFIAAKVLTLLPGEHTFVVQLSNYIAYGDGRSISFTTNNTTALYNLHLTVEPDHSYVLDFNDINTGRIPDQLCFLGERHSEPGSAVNITREYRLMSQGAKKFACTGIAKVNQPGS